MKKIPFNQDPNLKIKAFEHKMRKLAQYRGGSKINKVLNKLQVVRRTQKQL